MLGEVLLKPQFQKTTKNYSSNRHFFETKNQKKKKVAGAPLVPGISRVCLWRLGGPSPSPIFAQQTSQLVPGVEAGVDGILSEATDISQSPEMVASWDSKLSELIAPKESIWWPLYQWEEYVLRILKICWNSKSPIVPIETTLNKTDTPPKNNGQST